MTPVLRCATPTFVGIILTYRCTCACRHCLYACSPRRRGEMDRQTLRDTVRTLAALPHPPSVHLAGGEAFLCPDLLIEATAEVARAGLEMDFIETNAAWYRDDDSARELLWRLRDAGATRLLVSCTPFHAESVQLRKVATVVRLSEEVFGHAVLWTPDLYAQLAAIDPDGRIPFERYLRHVGEQTAAFSLLHRFPMTLAGRAAEGLADLLPRRPAHTLIGRPCRQILLGSGHAHFGPRGEHVPGYCAGLQLGDIADLPALVRGELPEDELPWVALLAQEGLAGLLRLAEQEHGFVPDPAGYRGPCHLCQVIRGHLLGEGVVSRDLGPRGFYEDLGLTPSSSTSPQG